MFGGFFYLVSEKDFFFLSEFFEKRFRGHFQGGMDSFEIVIVNTLVNRLYEDLYRFIFMRMIEFQFELPIVGFLSAVFPRRSLFTHGGEYFVFHKEIENEKTPVFASLIAMEYFRSSVRLYYGHSNRFKHEFLCMDERYGIPKYFPRERIDDGREIEMSAIIDDMGEVRSPDGIRTDRTPSFREIWNLGIWNVLIIRFYKPFRHARFGDYDERFHKPSRPLEPYFQIPGDTPVSVPWVFCMESIEGGLQKRILGVHDRSVVNEGSRRQEQAR